MIRLFIAVLCCVIACNLISAQSKPFVAPEPAWVTKNTIDYNAKNLDREASDGYVDLNYEKQISVADEAVYVKQALKIITDAGVQNASQVAVSFDQSFQRLYFHTIRIIRDGEIINKLELPKIKTIQQEEELKRFIYNGTLKSVLILEDVRKGDIIEYSYTLKGFNPVFQKKYSNFFDTQFSDPIYNIYYKIILPANRNIEVRNNREKTEPVITTIKDLKQYEWRLKDVHALHIQDNLPSWYDVDPGIMISEYTSWKEVNDWAATLFPKNAGIATSLKKKIDEIQTTHKDDDAKVAAALNFVQDNVRYMGIEMGVHSHKPASPDKVFNQRFGDCKEKSYLLCVMLWSMNIEANPVLINSNYKKSVLRWLPSPIDFDHCTVKVKLHNKTYWFDPTISYQRGSLDDISYPDYQCGLVVGDGSNELTNIPKQDKAFVQIKESFQMPGLSGHGHLMVTTINSGSYADDEREDFNENSNFDIQKRYAQYYQKFFEGLNADSLTFTDDETTGNFTTYEYYTIDSFWVNKDGKERKSFYPYVISNVIRQPKEKSRTMPFALAYPAKYREEVELKLPEDWDTKTFQENIRCPNFLFDADCKTYSNRVVITYDYETYKDHVMPEEAKTYFTDVKLSDDQNYELSMNDYSASTISKTSNKNILFALIPIILFIGALVWWSQRK